MWECPDFFTLDGQDILLMSPQGLEAQGDKYRNRDQTGYLIGKTQSDKTMKRGGFVEIDRGHDFYATQTMMTPDHRRVMIAWMNAWDSPMYEKADGWAGALTIPRELIVQNGRLIQRPIREIDSLRVKKICENEADVGYRIKLPRTAEILLDFDKAALEKGRLLKIGNEKQQMEMFVDKAHNRLVLQRQTADGERAAALPQLEHLKLHLFLDKSSAEIFVNDGDLTFTERLYWQGDIELELMAGAAKVTVYALEPETNRY